MKKKYFQKLRAHAKWSYIFSGYYQKRRKGLFSETRLKRPPYKENLSLHNAQASGYQILCILVEQNYSLIMKSHEIPPRRKKIHASKYCAQLPR